MKPFHVNSHVVAPRLTLSIQFMKFGVEDQEIVVPIRRRDKDNGTKSTRTDGAPPSPSAAATELPRPGLPPSPNVKTP